MAPEEALACRTVNAADVLARADRKGRLAPGYDADVVLVAPTTGATSRTTSAGRSSRPWSQGGKIAWRPLGIIDVGWPNREAATAAAKEFRHEYVWEDDEGNEVDLRGVSPQTARDVARRPRSAREAQPPSWHRTLKRCSIFAPIMFVTVMLLSPEQPHARTKVTQTAFIVAIFIPFSYFLDGSSGARTRGAGPSRGRPGGAELTSPNDARFGSNSFARTDRDELLRRPRRRVGLARPR